MDTPSPKEDNSLAGTIGETELASLLASLRHEPTKEADFESRFLSDFKDRLAHSAMKRSVGQLLRERIKAFFEHNTGWSWAYGSLAAVTVCAVGYSVWPQETQTQFAQNNRSLYTDNTVNLPVLLPTSNTVVTKSTATDIKLTTPDTTPIPGQDIINSKLFPQETQKQQAPANLIIERHPLGAPETDLIPGAY